MFIYLFLYLAILFGGLFFCRYQKNYKAFLILTMIMLFIVSTFRDKTMGADYQRYIDAFDSIGQGYSFYFEKGYVEFNRVISHITHKYFGLAAGVNLLLLVPLYFLLKLYVKKEYWFWCILIFAANPYLYVQSTFNALRQSCATGILIVGVAFFENKNFKKIIRVIVFFALLLLAAQFHRGIYIFLLYPLFSIVRFNKKDWYLISTAALALNVVWSSDILGRLLDWIGSYGQYADYDASLLNNPAYIGIIYVLVLFLIDHYSEITENPTEKKAVDIYLFSLCFLLFAVRNDMMYRVYIILAFLSLPGAATVLSKDFERTGKIRIKNGNSVIKAIYFGYYSAFYIGYFSYMALTSNYHYIPFALCF